MSIRKVTPYSQPMPESKGKKRIAAYCRVSSDAEEQLHSLAAQTTFYTKSLTEDKNSEFAGIYADEGISGTKAANRPQFQKLIEDCRSGLVDGIVTKSVSRFGRNTVDTLVYTRELRALGIDVYFEKENIHSCSAEGELLLTLMAAFAESESMSMSDNIKWGKRRRYEQGRAESLALANVYGYCQRDGALAIVEHEAEIVRRIYREYLDGLSYEMIAKGLNADSVPTRRGNDIWYNRTVQNIVLNEKNVGDVIFQKTFNLDAISKKHVRNRGELPQYVVEDCIPAIIDRTTWQLVQLEVKRRQERTRIIPSPEYPFRGRIVCGTCGRSVIQQSLRGNGEAYCIIWRCASRISRCKTDTDDCAIDSRVRYGRPEQVFTQAWNLMVSKKLMHQASLKQRAITSEDAMVRYRAGELYRLLDEVGRIEVFDFLLSLKVLDRMELQPNEKLSAVFLAGVRITL